MPKKSNKYPGIKKYPKGGYFARASFNGREYSKVLATLKAAIEWKTKLEQDLKRCPPEIVHHKGIWEGSISTPAGLRNKSSHNLDEVILWRDQNLAAIAGSYWRDAESGNQSLRDYIAHWSATKVDLAGKTKSVYNSLVNCHFQALLDLPLSGITKTVVKEWALELQRSGVGANTVKQSHDLLRQILKLAVSDEILTRNPVEGISLQKIVKKNKTALTRIEVDQLANECSGYGTLIRLTAAIGFRMQEVTALQVHDVNLFKREIHVSRAWSTDESGKRILSTTKTKQERTVPLPDFLVDDVKDAMVGKSPEDWLFTGAHGGSLDYGWFRRAVFMPAVKRLGLHGITPHSLRHTAISHMISAGAPITSVSGVAGHSNPQVTLAIYAHEFREDSRKFINQIWSKNEPQTEQERNSGGVETLGEEKNAS